MRLPRKVSALRTAVIALGVAMILWALRLAMIRDGGGAATVLGIYGALLLGALLCERSRYAPRVDRSVPGWQKTDEKFIDPVTGNPVQVWFNPATGERDYRPL